VTIAPAAVAPDYGPGRPATGQGLVILQARFGADNTYADVTAKTQAGVSGTELTGTPSQLGLGDPFPGRHKSFVVICREGGRVRLSVSGEADTVRLGSPPESR
jgi:hypothetical protein